MTGPEFNVAIRWERGSPELKAIFRSEAFVSLIGETHTFHWAFAWPDSDPVTPTWSEPSPVADDRQDMTVPHQAGYRLGTITLKQPPEPFLTLLAKENVIQVYTDAAGDSLWLEGSADGVQRFRQCMRRVGPRNSH